MFYFVFSLLRKYSEVCIPEELYNLEAGLFKKKNKKTNAVSGKKKKNKLSVPQDLADVALECFIEKIISTRC